MHRLSAVVLLLVFAALLAGCTNDPSSVSNVPGATVATSAGSGHESVVVRTDEIDRNADGATDLIITDTNRYDVHGNVVAQAHETSRFGQLLDRVSGTNEYNNHNDLIRSVFDFDQNGDGFADERDRLSTLETDGKGHPLRQVIAVDLGVDGSIDFTEEHSYQYDARGRVIAVARRSQTDAYEYDSHDNVARHTMHWAQGSRMVDLLYTGEWSVHDVEVASASTVAQTNQPSSGHALASIVFDAQGYPTLQDLVFKSGARVSNHVTIEITYDGHHRPLLRIASEDHNQDGRIDYRTTSRYDYQGAEVPAAHGLNADRTADLRGAAQFVAVSGKGPDGPSGGRFTR